MTRILSVSDKARLAMRNMWIKYIDPIVNKAMSLYSVTKVYGFKGLRLAKAYILGGNITIGKAVLRGRENIRRAIWLSRIGVRSGAIIERDRVVVAINGVYEFPFPDVLSDEESFKRLSSLAIFKYYLQRLKLLGGQCNDRGDSYICEFEGLRYVIRKWIADDIYAGPLAAIYEEPFEFKIFLRILKSVKDPLVIDVGAYVGAYSLRACRGGASVIALEPDPENYSVLKANLELNGCDKVKPLMVAAGSKEGMVNLYWGKFYTTSSIVPSFYDATSEIKARVRVDTLDSILSREGLLPESRIDFIKVDVEGAEVDVLKGASEVLKRVAYLLVEVRNENLGEVSRLLKEKGFRKLAEVRYNGYRNIVYKKS